MEQVSDARMSLDNDDIRKVMILKTSIASSVLQVLLMKFRNWKEKMHLNTV